MDSVTSKVYERLLQRDYKKYRKDLVVDISDIVNDKDLSLARRVSKRLLRMVDNETPVVFKEDRIGFMRTIRRVDEILSKEEREELSKDYLLFDGGIVCNISSDYEYTLLHGFDYRLKEIEEMLLDCNELEKEELIAMKESIIATYNLVEKYRPQKLEDIVGQKQIVSRLEKYVKP